MLNSGGIQVGWGEQWETLANAINDYYGGGVSSVQYQEVVQMLNSGNYTMEEMENVLGSIPEFSRTYNANGQLTRVSYNASSVGNTTTGNIANEINSNVSGGTNTQFESVQTVTKNQQTGKVTLSDSVKKYNAGTATTTKAVAANAISGIMAVSAGINAGKSIDQRLYNANPQFWDEHNMSMLNPQKWATITAGDTSLGATLFNFIFGINATTNNPEPYMEENTLAYMIAYMTAAGAFDPQTYVDTITPEQQAIIEWENVTDIIENSLSNSITVNGHTYTYGVASGSNIHSCLAIDTGNTQLSTFFSSDNPFLIQMYLDGSPLGPPLQSTSKTVGGNTYYTLTGLNVDPTQSPTYTGALNIIDEPWDSIKFDTNIGYIMLYGTQTIIGGVEGIDDQEDATQFDASGISDPTDIAAVLAALMLQFPEWWDNRIEISPDGENTVKYIPVGFPTGGVANQPTSNGASQSDLTPDITGGGENATDELIKTLIDMIQHPQEQGGMESNTTTPTQPVDPNDNGAGSGNTPPFVVPVGSASALYSVYNPSQSQLNSLGAWLWSSNFVDQLLKLFNDPMQALIGLHKIFASPSVSGTGNIKVGYLDSGVGSNLVGSQYTEVDCGKVKLTEYFKNALDYLNTDIYLYLPFIGIVSLNTVDVMRATIEVKYKVDVLTGACLATVNVYRDSNAGGQLYTYAGNCAVQYPLSSGSYMGIVAGVLGIAGSVASSVLSGGALLPMALGAGASAMSNMKTKVEHSGSLSGNAGAMGIKKPYLIIRRPQTKIAENFNLLNGISNNVYDILSSFTGETRVKYVHLENIPATSDELTEIEGLLKSGVVI